MPSRAGPRPGRHGGFCLVDPYPPFRHQKIVWPRTTSLLVASRQSGHLSCAQRPAIRLSLTGHHSCRATKQFTGSRYTGLARGTGEQAVMANAVEATWQDMEQEAADELVRRKRHDALPLRTIAAVVFVAEGDAGLVERNQTLARDGDPVGVAREIGEHPRGTGERRLGIDHPPLLPDRSEVTQETALVGET